MIRLVSLPAPLPITVADVKTHTRIDAADDDALLMSYLHGAIEQVERAAGVGFSGATWEWFGDDFPAGRIETGFGPITTVTSITYRDATGAEQTMPVAGYAADPVDTAGVIRPVDGWPETDGSANTVRVVFTAGDGNVPTPARNAIMMIVASAYEDRIEGGELSGPAQRLVGMYRRVWF